MFSAAPKRGNMSAAFMRYGILRLRLGSVSVVRVRSLLHADRIYKLMDSGLTFPQAARLDDASAALLIEAWDIAMEGQCDHGDDEGGIVVLHVGGPE